MCDDHKFDIGIEISDIYDGVLFWYNMSTKKATPRFPLIWYKNRNIDIKTIMDTYEDKVSQLIQPQTTTGNSDEN